MSQGLPDWIRLEVQPSLTALCTRAFIARRKKSCTGQGRTACPIRACSSEPFAAGGLLTEWERICPLFTPEYSYCAFCIPFQLFPKQTGEARLLQGGCLSPGSTAPIFKAFPAIIKFGLQIRLLPHGSTGKFPFPLVCFPVWEPDRVVSLATGNGTVLPTSWV